MLRVIELFAGIGSQTQALKNIGVKHKVIAISEIDKYAIKSYEALHGTANNLGDIRAIRKLPKADLWTYSFPCQDISVAGKLKGFSKDSGTRSGLLWEVERLLKTAAENAILPKYLLLENVKNLIGKKFRADFESWLSFLSSLGYTNYWKVLNAKDYCIPQNRERVFIVSIRGKHQPYQFPEKQELKIRLKDMLDEKVEDRYYLKESTVQSILSSKFNSRRDSIRDGNGLAACLRARDFHEPQCVTIGSLSGGKWDKVYKMSRRVFSPEGISPTVHCFGGGNTELKIAALRGRNPENPSDRTKGQATRQRLEENKKGLCNSLTTVHKDNLVMEKMNFVSRKYNEFIARKGYIPKMFVAYNSKEIKDIAPALTTQCTAASGSSAVLKLESNPNQSDDRKQPKYDTAKKDNYIKIIYTPSKALNTETEKAIVHDLNMDKEYDTSEENIRIRKLTPRECLRLMGWYDREIDKIQAAGISATQQYRQAGNGIVINVLEAIFCALFLKGEN